ncbi:TatD family hydrolase [Patescibacteria group bacterium]|nr:TatD family hydrolase [Patescibacteria group bacterium]
MNIRYIDAHCHLQFEQYAHDREAIIEEMRGKGIAAIVVGCDRESSRAALALAEAHEHLYAAVGLHPNYIGQESLDEETLQTLAAHPKVVAIGECGLDFFRPLEANEDVKRAQKEVLRKHIELAASFNKPLIIHARPSKGTEDAYQDLIELLREEKAAYPKISGDIHFFVGSPMSAETLIGLGFTVSFTAVITFAREYDSVIRTAPLAGILSETDAPYIAPVTRRGERNDPLAVVEVAMKIAEIRGEDPETVRVALLANALRMFSLPGRNAP